MKYRTLIFTALFTALLIGFGMPISGFAGGPYNIFVSITNPEIPGESTDEVHRDWIDAFALSDSLLIAIGNYGAGNPDFSDIRIIKGLDKAAQGCARKQPRDNAYRGLI